MTPEQLRRLARIGAMLRLSEITTEQRVIFSAFPDLGSPARNGRGNQHDGYTSMKIRKWTADENKRHARGPVQPADKPKRKIAKYVHWMKRPENAARVARMVRRMHRARIRQLRGNA